MESDMIIIYKLIHNLLGIILADAGLAILTNNTQGGGPHLYPSRATSIYALRFKFREEKIRNSLLANTVSSLSLTIFKTKLKQRQFNADLAFFV